MVLRARIGLLSADGLEIHEIAASLSVDRQVVRRWVKRYLEEGFDGLRDRPRCGRPQEIEHHVWQKLATVVVQAGARPLVGASPCEPSLNIWRVASVGKSGARR